MAPRVSTGRKLLFQGSHHKILSANSKVRITLQNSIKHFGREKVKWSPYFPMSSYCLIAIIFVHLLLLSLNVLFMSQFFATVKVQDYIMISELLSSREVRQDG